MTANLLVGNTKGMVMKRIYALIATLVLTPDFAVAEQKTFTPAELHSRTVQRRAVDAVIWGLPLVGEDAVKQAAFRDGKATYNDIVWWPKGGGWKNQSPTPNVNTRYMYFFINTKTRRARGGGSAARRQGRQLLRHHRRRVVCAAHGYWLRG